MTVRPLFHLSMRRTITIWKILWTGLLLLTIPLHSFSQTFAQALEEGQAFEVEWIQQGHLDHNKSKTRNYPRFPDQLIAGEYDIRIGLNLHKKGKDIVARIGYISYIELPDLANAESSSKQQEERSHPIILDTRFQDAYFWPQLYLFNALINQSFPISCDSEDYQQFLNEFADYIEQLVATSSLVERPVSWLQESSLPQTLETSSLTSFFCTLLKQAIPVSEGPYKIQSRKQGGYHIVNYLRVDHPAKTCLIKGQIESPATNQVRVKFFKEGNWLNYWQDSLINLSNDGSFELAFLLDDGRMVSIYHGYQAMRFYFEPGDTLEFQTDANAFYSEMGITGSTPADNDFLLAFYHQMRGDTLFRSYDHQLLEKEPNSFFKKLRGKERNELSFLRQHHSSLRPSFAAFMDRYIKLDYANVKWEAAYRFSNEKGIQLESNLVHHLQESGALLYRLPVGKTFDFNPEEYLRFQFHRLRDIYPNAHFNTPSEDILAQLLPSKETYVRHTAMQLFRQYGELGQLTSSSQHRLARILNVSKDSNLNKELLVFAQGKQPRPTPWGYRGLQAGSAAPDWSFRDKEGVKIDLQDFANKKLLLHIGWSDNLDRAVEDLEVFKGQQNPIPEVVHLVAADSKNVFAKSIADKQGLFIFVPAEDMQDLKEKYFIDNNSNHYFLIGEDGNILANHLTLGTAQKLRGTWEKVVEQAPATAWTPEQRLQFWQSIGIGALMLLLISGAVLWQRRIYMRRDLRRRQLLEVELKGIRSQMNPHFLFNAMSSIQNLIRKSEQEKADSYLGQFAGLMRKTLRNTAEEYIPLSDEIETLKQYCSLESLRHPFGYKFLVDEKIDIHNTYIPSMILQPIIENAIIHGLAAQTNSRILKVKIEPGTVGLHCTVEDNGIGIVAARQFSPKKEHQSFGMKLVRQRLELLGLSGQEHLSIIDRSTLSPPTQGTLVTLTIPIEQ